jgi:hypothetical protein
MRYPTLMKSGKAAACVTRAAWATVVSLVVLPLVPGRSSTSTRN